MEELLLEGECDDPEGDEEAANAGHDIRTLPSDDALDSKCQDQLQTSETGHEVGGYQLQRLGQGGEGE